MRVSKIQLTDLGPFDDVTLDIPAPPDGSQGELVLFEGPNGSGKTTLMETLVGGLAMALDTASYGGPSLARRKQSTSQAHLTWQPSGVLEAWKISLFGGHPAHKPNGQSFSQSHEMAGLQAALRGSREARVVCGAFAYDGLPVTPSMKSQGPRELEHGPLYGALSFGREEPLARQFGQVLTNIESERTKAMAYALERPAERERLQQRAGALLASQRRMEDALSRVLDREVRFAFELQRQAPRVLFDGEEVQLDLLGEGMRRTFSWLADLMARLELTVWEDEARAPFDQEFLLFLDEVDQSLHPTMQMRLMPTLHKLFPQARIYATTHSPFVVASVEEGYVFSIRPDHRTHRVSGAVESQHLQGGRTLESVVNDVFDAPATFIDETSRTELQKHKAQVDALRSGGEIDEVDFMERRRRLHDLGEEIWTVVAMREVPARKKIEEIKQRASAREAGE
jgi:predicted ATP-binding protein involved in virulence